MTGRTVLAADDVTMRFGRFTAVDGVSLAVGSGEIVGLLGANGAGKTTLIRVLLGLLAPTGGSSTLMGGVPDREHRRVLGYVPQGLGLYPDLTVTENAAFVAGLHQVPVPALPEQLQAVADRLVRDLPLGQQRQLAFVCALLHEPEVLVLDEPTSGVSAAARAALWDIIHEQSARGAGVLVTTHYMQEAQQCDRLLLMSRGSLVAAGSEADIIGDITAVAVRAEDWSAAFSALDAAGQAVTLAGRRVRVADGRPDEILQLLADRGIAAEADVVPATIEERMTLLTRAEQR
jgi:ABC-2 type transport system ATP-binding protein